MLVPYSFSLVSVAQPMERCFGTTLPTRKDFYSIRHKSICGSETTLILTPWSWGFPGDAITPRTPRNGRSTDTHFAYVSTKYSSEVIEENITPYSKAIIPVTKQSVLVLLEGWENNEIETGGGGGGCYGDLVKNRYRAIVIDNNYSPPSEELYDFFLQVENRLVNLDEMYHPDCLKYNDYKVSVRTVTGSSQLLVVMVDSDPDLHILTDGMSKLGKAEMTVDTDNRCLKVTLLVSPGINTQMFDVLNDYALFSRCDTITVTFDIPLVTDPENVCNRTSSFVENGFSLDSIIRNDIFTTFTFTKFLVYPGCIEEEVF